MLRDNTIVKELDELDLEWLELILEAKRIGISINEIHEFLNYNKR